MAKTNTIKPFESYVNVPDKDIVNRALNVVTKMTGNSNFQNPPVALVDLKTDTDALSALMAEALDGSKKVMAEKKKQRAAVVKKLRLLGRYVEYACKDDMTIFLSSGFEPVSNTRTQAPGLSENIRRIDHGEVSGQVVVRVKKQSKTLSCELRHAPVAPDNGGTPPVWTTEVVTSVKTPVTVTGLKPGTTYAFQIRSLAKAGYSDWSDPVTFMCT
jgi:hypothetical protein